jgi:hypothetical protein
VTLAEYAAMQPDAGMYVVFNHKSYVILNVQIYSELQGDSKYNTDYMTLAKCLEVDDNGDDIGNETIIQNMDAVDWKYI